jgi:hypothetical protein
MPVTDCRRQAVWRAGSKRVVGVGSESESESEAGSEGVMVGVGLGGSLSLSGFGFGFGFVGLGCLGWGLFLRLAMELIGLLVVVLFLLVVF